MNQIPPETRRIQSLLTSLIIVSILIIGLVLIIAAYPTILRPFLAPATPPGPSPRPSNTITITPTITPTPTQTRTLRPTLTPSITPTPTDTLLATSTPTPPGPPTLTPAQPVKSDPYKFTEWTSDLANLSIELMKDYPNTLIPRLRGDDNRGYYEAFYYATIAEKEGLMRFPEAPQALQWQYSLAYNLAQMGDPQAGEAYAALITQALNQGEVYLEGLPVWFQLLEPRLNVNHIQLTPPSGFLSSHILEVHGPGSAFIWLLETPSGYQADVLDSNFDFVQAPEMRLIVSDFNGDGIDDAAIFNSAPDGTNLEKPRVFDLSEMPATELSFRPSDPVFQPGIDYINNWRPAKATTTAETPTTQDGSDLMLDLRLFPACPVTVRQTFHWNGTYFELAQSDFEVEPAPGTLSLCRIIVDHAADLWGPQAAVQIMEQLLPDWPPALDEEGKPYPADAKDEWRLRLGIYHALLGNFDQAVGYFNELVEKPSQPNSRWVEPAKQFLSLYRSPQDVYRACVENQFCDPNRALDYLVNQLGIPDGQDPVEYLNQNGVTLRSSGYFDFDGDEVKERWITIRHHPLEKLDLWVLAAAKDGLRAIEVSQVEGDRPNLQFLNEDEKPPIIWVDSGIFVTFGRDIDSGQPYLTLVSPKLEFPNRFREGLDQARQALFAGEDLNIVLDLLVGLETSPGLLCKSNWTCDEYYYLLGLTNELLGNQRAAIEAFLTLWRDYSRSPFTTLARLKLARTRELPTPIPTSTLTAFPTSLLTPRTPTATFTLMPGQTPSVTPVPSGTLPVDLSPTPTLTSPPPYLYPTVTRRPTATSQPYQ